MPERRLPRRAGAEFLEYETIIQHLSEYENRLLAEIAQARKSGRGKNYLQNPEDKLRWLETAREYAVRFREGQGVGGAVGIETGPGAIVTAAIGGLVGGIVGFFLGEETVDELYRGVEKVPELFRDTPRLLETTTLMFGSDEARRAYGDLKELETGERPVWDLF